MRLHDYTPAALLFNCFNLILFFSLFRFKRLKSDEGKKITVTKLPTLARGSFDVIKFSRRFSSSCFTIWQRAPSSIDVTRVSILEICLWNFHFQPPQSVEFWVSQFPPSPDRHQAMDKSFRRVNTRKKRGKRQKIVSVNLKNKNKKVSRREKNKRRKKKRLKFSSRFFFFIPPNWSASRCLFFPCTPSHQLTESVSFSGRGSCWFIFYIIIVVTQKRPGKGVEGRRDYGAFSWSCDSRLWHVNRLVVSCGLWGELTRHRSIRILIFSHHVNLKELFRAHWGFFNHFAFITSRQFIVSRRHRCRMAVLAFASANIDNHV